MKYRKKPVEIEAFRLGFDPLPEWFKHQVAVRKILCDPLSKIAVIDTLEGEIQADFGDFIIKGVEGEIYPCKPNIFEKTYEKVKE